MVKAALHELSPQFQVSDAAGRTDGVPGRLERRALALRQFVQTPVAQRITNRRLDLEFVQQPKFVRLEVPFVGGQQLYAFSVLGIAERRVDAYLHGKQAL